MPCEPHTTDRRDDAAELCQADLHGIVCLGCGSRRLAPATGGRLNPGACADCGDVSWSRPADLSGRDRALLRLDDDEWS